MQLADSKRIDKDTYLETSDFPGAMSQLLVSGFVFIISCLVIAIFSEPYSIVEIIIPLFIMSLIAFLLTGFPQFYAFWKLKKEILTLKNSVRRSNSNRDNLVRLGLMSLFLVMFFSPFILLSFLSPAEWLSSVLGMVIGVSGAQFFFMLYVKSWEMANKVRLKRFSVYLHNEKKRKVVLEYGIRAEKS